MLFKNYLHSGRSKKSTYPEGWILDFHRTLQRTSRHPEVLRMKYYTHHGKTSCYDHCRHVAFFNYMWARRFKLDHISAARAGMLHDLFLYDWHTHARETGERLHGLTHPKTALLNARRHFRLNHIEQDTILNHMWPVTFFHFPRTKEGWLIVLSDKYCSLLETLRLL